MSEHLPSGRRGQMLAVGITAILIVVSWTGIVAPLTAAYENRAQRVDDDRRLAARMAAIAVTVPDLLRQVAAARAAAPEGRDLVLEAPSDAVAGARLQQHMQDLAAATDITLSSVETLPARQEGSYRRISLRVVCSASWPTIVGLMQKLELSSPKLLIDDLNLAASPDLNQSSGISIAATFTVIAFRPGTAA